MKGLTRQRGQAALAETAILMATVSSSAFTLRKRPLCNAARRSPRGHVIDAFIEAEAVVAAGDVVRGVDAVRALRPSPRS